jgi:hemoglobin
MTDTTGTLYERLGGVYGIAGAVDVLVDRLFANAAVNTNAAVHAHHGNPANAPGYKFLVTAWSIEAAGGPKCYFGQDMERAHDELHIDEHGFDAVKMEIAATLNFLDVPIAEHNEFMDIIERYRPEVVAAA